MARLVGASIAVVAALGLGAAACSPAGESVVAEAHPSEAPTPVPATTPEPTAIRFLDDELSETDYYMSWDHASTVEELVARSAVVFTARLVGVQQAVFVDGPDAEDPAEFAIEWDGLVFEVEEMLKADRLAATITVALPAVARDPAHEEGRRVEVEPLGVVRPALEILDQGRAADQRFLVFGSELVRGVYRFETDAGVVEVNPDGSLETGAAPPFLGTGVAGAVVPNGVTIAEVRSAVGA